MSANIWKQRLAASPQHQWFEAFEDAPQKALEAILWRRFDLANLSTLDVDDLLSRWVLTIGNQGHFAAKVDAALAEWIEGNWGDDTCASPDTLRALWATVAQLLCTSYVPANKRYFDNSARVLRNHLLDEPGFAPQLFSPRGRDAFYACLNAVALYQKDDYLRSLWLQLAELPNGYPSRYAIVALTGIRRMRAPNGGFRFDLGHGLFVVARSFSRLIRDGVVSEDRLLDDFSFIYRRARSQFPSWAPAWAALFATEWREEFRRNCSEGIARFLDQQARALRRFSSSHASFDPNPRRSFSSDLQPTWETVRDPKNIELKLLRKDKDALKAANWLLNQQRRHGLTTGNFTYLVRSLQKFAVAVRNTARSDRNLLLAQDWVVEITERDPDDPRGWNLLVNILKRRDEFQATTWRAWRLAWALIDRFPGDAYCRTGLAEVLKSQGRLNEAEEVYRQAVEDFPHAVVARCGLAEVLKSHGRFDEAEKIYRRAVEDFPRDGYARAGLAYLLGGNAVRDPANANEYLTEAERHYRAALANRPERRNMVFVFCGLGWICEKLGRLEDAKIWYLDAIQHDRNYKWAKDGLVRVKQRAKKVPSVSTASHELELEIPDLLFATNEPASPATVSWAEYLESEFELTEHHYQQAKDAIPAERVMMRSSEDEHGRRSQNKVPWSIVGYRLRMARAAFFRRSARWQELLPTERRSMEPSTLRSAARKLVDEVIVLRPNDTRAYAELFALDLEEESYPTQDSSAAMLSLRNAPTAELLQVAGIAARLKSRREKYCLHDVALRDEVFGPIRSLRSFDAAAKPLCELGEGLAALAMVDSAERLQLAATSLDKLRLWVAPKAKRVRTVLLEGRERDLEGISPFEAWSHAISERFFKPCGISDDHNDSLSLSEIRLVDEWLQDTTNQRHVADMEYRFARLLTPAIEESLALA